MVMVRMGRYRSLLVYLTAALPSRVRQERIRKASARERRVRLMLDVMGNETTRRASFTFLRLWFIQCLCDCPIAMIELAAATVGVFFSPDELRERIKPRVWWSCYCIVNAEFVFRR